MCWACEAISWRSRSGVPKHERMSTADGKAEHGTNATDDARAEINVDAKPQLLPEHE